MRLTAIPPAVAFVSVLALIGGGALTGAAAWSRPLRDADEAVRAGRLEEALDGFAAVEARFERVPLVGRLLPAAREASIANQLWLLHRLRRYDALLDKASAVPPGVASHFWAGCALYEKARVEQDPDARLTLLGSAAEELRQALELRPDAWDIKYNYELAARLLAQIEKEPKTPQQQMLQLLRPMAAPTSQTPRPVG